MLEASQSVVAAYRYDPFGILLTQTGSLTQPYGFSTKRYDAQIGMIHYGFRDYIPALARWTTRDPLGESGGMNLYAFVGNNPVNWIDPWGLYVKGTFFRQYNWLLLKDTDTGQVVSVHKVYSGNGACANNPACEHLEDRGPLPAGEYLIGNVYRKPSYCNAHPGGNCAWYPLYGPDGTGGYSFYHIPVNDPTTGQPAGERGKFYLHTGRASNGCITVWSDVGRADPTYPTSTDFDTIQQLLENTTQWFYSGDGTYYRGKLIVK